MGPLEEGPGGRPGGSPFLCAPNPRIPSSHVYVHLRRSGHHHRHLSLPRLLRTLQIPQCPQLQGVGWEKTWWGMVDGKGSLWWWHTGSKGAKGVRVQLGLKTRMFPPHPWTLKIEHTETDAVSSRSSGRPPSAAAVPKSAVSALQCPTAVGALGRPLQNSVPCLGGPLVPPSPPPPRKSQPEPDLMAVDTSMRKTFTLPTRSPSSMSTMLPTDPKIPAPPPTHKGQLSTLPLFLFPSEIHRSGAAGLRG